MFLFIIIFLVLSPLSSLAADSQPDETLAPVVVTATRIETPQEEVTTSLSVITSEDIRAKQAVTVEEVLRDVPGLDVVQSGSRGATTSVFIRGSDSDQVLVLIDGVEVNSVTSGGFNFAHLTTESVERIEVLLTAAIQPHRVGVDALLDGGVRYLLDQDADLQDLAPWDVGFSG